jgi:hypothetical protein
VLRADRGNRRAQFLRKPPYLVTPPSHVTTFHELAHMTATLNLPPMLGRSSELASSPLSCHCFRNRVYHSEEQSTVTCHNLIVLKRFHDVLPFPSENLLPTLYRAVSCWQLEMRKHSEMIIKKEEEELTFLASLPSSRNGHMSISLCHENSFRTVGSPTLHHVTKTCSVLKVKGKKCRRVRRGHSPHFKFETTKHVIKHVLEKKYTLCKT